MTATTCTDCNEPLGRRWCRPFDANNHGCDGDACEARLCSRCHDKHPLMIPKPNLPEDLAAASLHRYCSRCFQEKSTIDYSRTYEIIEGTSDYCFVYVHGASGSRTMFRGHAEEMYKRFGHGAVLMDLPGHATLVDVPLTLESAAEKLEKAVAACPADKKLVYVGGSLGAYIGFYLLERFQDKFVGGVLMDCGQNVGPGASWQARMGLVLLEWLGSKFSNATLMKMMADVGKKSKADFKLVSTCYGAGMFFDQAAAHVACLRAVAPSEYLPKIQVPILFMNGSEDHRDSEDRWLAACANKASELKVYQGGDHFFTHDSRFIEDILERMNAFVKKL